MYSIPVIEVSEIEQLEIQKLLSQPVVKKYFGMLASNIVRDLCTGAPADTESDSIYIRKESGFKGQLALLETLLSIQPIKPQE